MKLLSSIKCPKGITLNSQLVDLLLILEDETLTEAQQDKKISEYIANIAELDKIYKNFGKNEKRKSLFRIDKIVEKLDLTESEQDKLKSLYRTAYEKKLFFDLGELNKLLLSNGFEESVSENINIQVLKDSRNLDLEIKDGLDRLNSEKVRAFREHLFKDGKNMYDRVTFDNAGKYSSYVSIDGKTYADERLAKMISFCENHGMKSKINTFFMYCDFPNKLEGYLLSLEDDDGKPKYSENDVKQILKESLFNYVRNIGEKYGKNIDTIDIFNELIYDDQMKVEGFDEEPTYHPRKEGWQKYLDIEDMCEMALEARKLMPDVKFTYNDMHWLETEKRKEIIKIIKQIKEIEKRYQEEGKLGKGETLIDNIGLEAHLTTGDATMTKIAQMDKTIKELNSEIGLPIEITELDVAMDKTKDFKTEVKKQNKIFRKIRRLVKNKKISALTIWSPSDDLSFMNEIMNCAPNENVHASVLNSNFEEKDIGRESLKAKIINLFDKMKQRKLSVGEVASDVQASSNTNIEKTDIERMREKFPPQKPVVRKPSKAPETSKENEKNTGEMDNL